MINIGTVVYYPEVPRGELKSANVEVGINHLTKQLELPALAPRRHRGLLNMLAISVQQPFAYFIIHCGKDVENRKWIPHGLQVGEELAIIASKSWHVNYNPYKSSDLMDVIWDRVAADLESAGINSKGVRPIDFKMGGVIGTVIYRGAVENSPSVWAEQGQHHWLLSDPKPLPFTHIKGRLGIYEVEIPSPFQVVATYDWGQRLLYEGIYFNAFNRFFDALRVASRESTLNPELPKTYVFKLRDGRYAYEFFDTIHSHGRAIAFVDKYGAVAHTDLYDMDELDESAIICAAVRFPSPSSAKEINWELIGAIL